MYYLLLVRQIECFVKAKHCTLVNLDAHLFTPTVLCIILSHKVKFSRIVSMFTIVCQCCQI